MRSSEVAAADARSVRRRPPVSLEDHLELGLLLIACLSAAAGFALRRRVSRTLGRILLILGVGSLASALGVIGIMVYSQGRIIGMWSGGMLVLGLLGGAALVLPFALAVSWGRFSR